VVAAGAVGKVALGGRAALAVGVEQQHLRARARGDVRMIQRGAAVLAEGTPASQRPGPLGVCVWCQLVAWRTHGSRGDRAAPLLGAVSLPWWTTPAAACAASHGRLPPPVASDALEGGVRLQRAAGGGPHAKRPARAL
jgi:hypothetical protein